VLVDSSRISNIPSRLLDLFIDVHRRSNFCPLVIAFARQQAVGQTTQEVLSHKETQLTTHTVTKVNQLLQQTRT